MIFNIKNSIIDFSGLFPTYSEGFSWEYYKHNGQVFNNYIHLWSDIYKELGDDDRYTDFSRFCTMLAIYLNHIRTKNIKNIQSCCKYFYYKLNKYIIEKFSPKCINPYDCYKKMAAKRVQKLYISISEICLKSINYPQDIDESIFPIFVKVDNLYNAFTKLNTVKPPSKSNLDDFRWSMKQLETHQNEYNETFIKFLADVNNLFINFVKGLDIIDLGVEGVLCYIKMEEREKGILKIKQSMSVQDSVTETATNADTYKDEDIGVGTGMGIGFLSFSILIIYTPYFSFLQTRVRKLRRVMKKNNICNLDLMHASNVEYKNSIDDTYKIV
ncbi:variable surface protein [Plasmodium gonderi]|uniref:Variable surface protein n=1 Tax=Plasmodium gonderi TaxID=77519 RepID=A0A1Y1JRJ1_PLAGO|nr:variable surface protein [Plasmodium gonderi]GAW84105.1 variable surface protein [Plasmodium gonderi]